MLTLMDRLSSDQAAQRMSMFAARYGAVSFVLMYIPAWYFFKVSFFFTELSGNIGEFPDYLPISWPTFKIPDFFQTLRIFQTSRHHELESMIDFEYYKNKNQNVVISKNLKITSDLEVLGPTS